MFKTIKNAINNTIDATIINAFTLLSRYFIPLDPVLNSYYKLAEPKTFSGDFEIEVEISTSNTTSNLVIASGGSGTYVQLISTGGIALRFGGTYIQFNNLDAHKDGKLHKIKGTSAGNITHLYIDGIKQGSGIANGGATDIFQYIGSLNGGSQEFDGIIANVKFTDKSGASDVVTTFKLDNSPAAANYMYSTELLDNNTFTNGIADWYSPRSLSSLSIINNKLVSIADSTGVFGAGQQIDNLIVGNAYRFVGTATCSNSSATVRFRFGTEITLATSIFEILDTGTVAVDTIFTAIATTMYFGTIVTGHVANDTVTIDAGITVKEITNYTEANAASEIEYSQENVFGSEKVVNGDFSGGTTGWTENGASLDTTSGEAVVLVTGSNGYVSTSFATVIGKTYTFSGEILIAGASFTGIRKSDNTTASLNNVDIALNAAQVATSTFTATATTTYAVLQVNGTGNTATFDNISVKEITNAVEYKNIPQTARELYSLEDDTWVGSNELVVNGDFATDSDWTKGTGILISGGSAVFDSVPSAQLLRQSIVFKIGVKYIVTFTISGYVEGGIYVRQPTNDYLNIFTSNGTHTTTITATNASVFDLRAAGVTTLLIDNVSIVEVIEVAEQAAFSPVTAPMTLTEAWTTRGAGYLGLQNTTSASVRVDTTISNTDSGILMESGATGIGIVLYVYSGVLYFQCGRGNAYGTASYRAEVSYTLPVGESDYIIEWSADTSNAVLYVNGVAVGSQTFSESLIAGSDAGTLGEVESVVSVNRGGWTTDGNGSYTNTITKCDIFKNQITSDV